MAKAAKSMKTKHAKRAAPKTAKAKRPPPKKKAAPTKRPPETKAPEATTEAWSAQMEQASTESRWAVPWFVLMQEAAVASAFVEQRWKKARGEGRNGQVILGLETVATHLPATVAREIHDLQSLAQKEHYAYLRHTRPVTGDDPRPRADHVLSEVTAALEFLFDDGVDDERDAQHSAVAHAHTDDGDSNVAIAGELDDYGSLAGEYRSELDGLGGFDAALLDEIPALAKALRAPTAGGATERSPEATAALHRRNRLGNLLRERIGRVRSAAQFVFRARPEIAREVTGTYLRRKRAAARRASAAKTPKVEKPEVR